MYKKASIYLLHTDCLGYFLNLSFAQNTYEKFL